jgi:cellulose synthase/poly-beta-1,6-N-acetylglucosamine synthase-like glycosyltransferase
MELVFWICIASAAYVYVGYPLLLALAGKTRRYLPPDGDAETLPKVTLVISAYNEESVIREKLENSVAMDYPADSLQIIVVSDCSDDGTDSLVEAFPSPQVQLLKLTERAGKSAGLNEALANASGELVLFTDANAMFEAAALRAMARHFQNPGVGAVTGSQQYFEAQPGDTTDEGLYWRYELAITRLESQVGSLVGGDGAILAIRKDLFTPLDASDLSDFVLPLRIVGAGYRNVYEPEAVCYEHSAESTDKEFARKVRIVNRAWRATLKLKEMLNPFRYGWFSLQLISHKLLRWFVGLFMLGALISNLFLLDQSIIYKLMFIGQISFYALALLGWRLDKPGATVPVFFSAPYYLCLVNLAGLIGVARSFTGETFTTWNTARTSTDT